MPKHLPSLLFYFYFQPIKSLEAYYLTVLSFTGVTSGMTTAQEFQAYPYDRIISTLGQLISVPEDKSGCPL